MDEFKEFKRTQISEMRKVSDKDINNLIKNNLTFSCIFKLNIVYLQNK